MKRFKQFTSFIISDFTTNVWTHPRHNHNHYELIFIEKGAGKHKINKNEIAYEKGALFLLGPDDSHEFEKKKINFWQKQNFRSIKRFWITGKLEILKLT